MEINWRCFPLWKRGSSVKIRECEPESLLHSEKPQTVLNASSISLMGFFWTGFDIKKKENTMKTIPIAAHQLD